MERMIDSIGKLDRKVDWVEKQMDQMKGWIGKLVRKVDMVKKIGKKHWKKIVNIKCFYLETLFWPKVLLFS